MSSGLFTECKNSIPSSRYLCLSAAGYGGNRPFSLIFSHMKIMLKMIKNREYFYLKWALNMFGDVLKCRNVRRILSSGVAFFFANVGIVAGTARKFVNDPRS